MGKTDKVIEALNDRGFILELNVFRRLKSKGWNTVLSNPFWNVCLELDNSMIGLGKTDYKKEQEKIRAMDVYATKVTSINKRNIGPLAVDKSNTSIVIECKKRSNENWVFYQEEPTIKTISDGLEHISPGGMYLVDYLTRIGKIQRGDFKNHDILRTSHHCLGEIDKIATAGVPIFGPKNKNGLYDSCEQVISAFEYAVSTHQTYTNRFLKPNHLNMNWRLYPIIVFDGPLWEVILENDTISVRPLKWLVYEHRRGNLTHLIDIVSWDAFDDFCNILEKEIENLSKL